ncbi:MAG: DNA-binding protein YbiB [Pseudomonadota bacterium]|jgi:anthranilate phosphoribosyltransferase
MNLPNLIKEIGRGAKGARSLSADEAEMLFTAMLQGAVPDLELGAILIALRVKGESDEELIGFCRAMQSTTHTIQATDNTPIVVLPTYNGVRRQPNLLPLLAILLRDAGLKVLIHGRHDFDHRENPFPLFKALGVHVSASIAQAQTQLDETGIALLDIEQLNPGLNALLNLRSRLGVRNTAHTLCKLLDPCPGQSIRVVNVTHPEYLIRMTSLLTTQRAHAMLLRGTEGEAFANPRRRPELMGFKTGRGEVLFAAEEGGTPPIAGWPENADFDENQKLIHHLLAEPERLPQPILDQVLALKALC